MDKKKIVQMYEQGESIYQISKALGLRTKVIKKIIEESTMEELLKCNTCEQEKKADEFYKSSKTKCRDCWKEHWNKLKEKKKAEQDEQVQ